MRKLVRVYGPSGCDEANYGTERFVRHEDGHFDVPEEALQGLLTVGGFTVAPPDQPASDDGQSADVTPAVDASLGYPDPEV